MEEIRFPYGPLQKAVYDRLKAASPTMAVYATVPLADPANPTKAVPLPYVVLGRFSGVPDRAMKEERLWSVGFTINLWSESTNPSELAGMIATVLGAISRTQLSVEENWNIYSLEVDSGEVFEVIFEEFGPVLHGSLTLRFGIEDVS